MKRIAVLVLALLLVSFALSVTPAQAGTRVPCWSDPSSGTAGTVFHLYCSGFPSNTVLWVYVREPDGLSSAAYWNLDFQGSGTDSGSTTKTDKDGNTSAVWRSYGTSNGFYSQALGPYTFVFQVADGSIAGETTVNIESTSSTPLTGAKLWVDPSAGRTFAVYGSGFAPYEAVDIWVSQPLGCSSAQNAVEAEAIRPDEFGSGFGRNGIEGPGTVKADADGNIAFVLNFDPNSCRGQFAVSARALGSGAGAVAWFEVTGRTVVENTRVWVNPDNVSALDPRVTVYGSGFPAGASVNCWFTRPDGRVAGANDQNFGAAYTGKVDADGTFAISIVAGNSTYANPYLGLVSAEEPGLWYVTCATPDHSSLGTATFNIYSLALDP